MGAPAAAGPPPLYQTIYDELRRHIVEARLPEGLVIGPSGVARAFGASRVPATAALRRLADEGLIRQHDGRGYLVGNGPPIERELEAAGLKVERAPSGPSRRNRHAAIYPEVEHVISASLAHGRFLVNESALAVHYRVSRTVAHEVLTRLERTGIIVRGANQRWYAGPLTPDALRHHYEMRWTLEPVALRQAFPRLERRRLGESRARVAAILAGAGKPARIARVERLEHDLHYDVLEGCANPLLLSTIRRSQLPLLATHWTFQRFQDPGEIVRMAEDHVGIFEALIAGRIEAAAAALEAHLRRSVEPNIELLRRLGDPAPELRRPYLVRVG